MGEEGGEGEGEEVWPGCSLMPHSLEPQVDPEHESGSRTLQQTEASRSWRRSINLETDSKLQPSPPRRKTNTTGRGEHPLSSHAISLSGYESPPEPLPLVDFGRTGNTKPRGPSHQIKSRNAKGVQTFSDPRIFCCPSTICEGTRIVCVSLFAHVTRGPSVTYLERQKERGGGLL